ncbi:membrane protein [Polymorphobacter glacialis]|uniref:Membrane protein n=1 Tax=Sandarakinorhabdus glacialis TaxID=1614636 RepID=A0A916ZIY8_9SPHN|nr:OmpA family protein [Polymorphobacter glacialis]GGD98835.1 membrane protein [Polymorphobacter glacialis]
MRKFGLALALATTVLAGPALARDKAWYVGVEGGGNLMQNQLFDITRPGVGTTAPVVVEDGIRVKHEVGYAAGGTIGYDFGAFRAEFEVGYKNNNLDQVTIEQAIPAIPISVAYRVGAVAVPALGVNTDAADGNARVLSFMANGLFDFGGKDGGIGGFIGGGAGIARVQHHIYQNAKFGPAFNDDSDTGFAYQVLAGVYKPITDHIEVGLKYRFFNVPKVETFTTNGLATETKYRSHSLMLTLAYNFFEPEMAPPPPPPAPAPAPAPLPPCPPAAVTPGPFLVFFDWDKSLITAEASAILDRAAEQYAATGQTSIVLAGHADTSGTAEYNMRLSQRRSDSVKAYMAAKGVPDSSMTTEAFGETRLLVETADGVREPQNRRVEITFSGAPQPTSSGPCTPQ